MVGRPKHWGTELHVSHHRLTTQQHRCKAYPLQKPTSGKRMSKRAWDRQSIPKPYKPRDLGHSIFIDFHPSGFRCTATSLGRHAYTHRPPPHAMRRGDFVLENPVRFRAACSCTRRSAWLTYPRSTRPPLGGRVRRRGRRCT